MKILRTILILLSLIFAALLWATRLEYLPSMSAFALSPNVSWYWLMHLTIIATFIWDAFVTKKWQALIVAICGVATLVLDMYNFPLLHNIATASLFITASYNLIRYSHSKQERIYSIVNCGTAAILFLLGLYTNVHLFFAEGIVMFCIGISMTRRIWIAS